MCLKRQFELKKLDWETNPLLSLVLEQSHRDLLVVKVKLLADGDEI